MTIEEALNLKRGDKITTRSQILEFTEYKSFNPDLIEKTTILKDFPLLTFYELHIEYEYEIINKVLCQTNNIDYDRTTITTIEYGPDVEFPIEYVEVVSKSNILKSIKYSIESMTAKNS